MASDAVERDPPPRSEGFVADSGVGPERSVPLTSRVLFPQEEDFQTIHSLFSTSDLSLRD